MANPEIDPPITELMDRAFDQFRALRKTMGEIQSAGGEAYLSVDPQSERAVLHCAYKKTLSLHDDA